MSVTILHNTQSNKKKVTCAKCKRTMETIKDENPPYFCYKCQDYLDIGGFHEMPSNHQARNRQE